MSSCLVKNKKMTQMNNEIKHDNMQEWVKLLLAVMMAIAGIALLIVGMVIPPAGQIDSSIIVAAGEVFIFSGAILGIKLTYDYKLAKIVSALNNRPAEDKK